ncbi:phosphoribosylanthranilate isomerase [Caldinitratiruptor microaerophilus]|uniref:N-(5'-phosphoribosyl)anthranilate isomerase n=1 Tax=Caldinitratiruptor microaerophilus TaxID=671077 RepID=A0AA35G9T9_9FIRM|nr:phosphoribosylanthranilate isomerase [Caldinitratiruptor microaerophilus]BDG60634.1 N-(5'-phosphoribosyl)anthranilate isomerase [Caldinitratiruptor microaerophilus]
MWVKICGIRTPEAARAAAEAGADAVGFVFAPSRRQVAPEEARRLGGHLPPGVARVGVFVDLPVAQVVAVARAAGLTHVQLHGDEPPEVLEALPLPVIKGVRLAGRDDLSRLLEYTRAWGILVEPRVSGQAGGTGVALDRVLGREARDLLRRHGYTGKFILAGGLDPDTVAEAVRAVGPDGVDVSSGVETGGQKDPDKIRAFVRSAREGTRP